MISGCRPRPRERKVELIVALYMLNAPKRVRYLERTSHGCGHRLRHVNRSSVESLIIFTPLPAPVFSWPVIRWTVHRVSANCLYRPRLAQSPNKFSQNKYSLLIFRNKPRPAIAHFIETSSNDDMLLGMRSACLYLHHSG
jgi:hypothetical protein